MQGLPARLSKPRNAEFVGFVVQLVDEPPYRSGSTTRERQ